MALFSIAVESPPGSGAFVPTGRVYDEAAAGYIASFLAALDIQTGQTFTAPTLISGMPLLPPIFVQQPSAAQQAAAAAAIADGIVAGRAWTDAKGNPFTDPNGLPYYAN